MPLLTEVGRVLVGVLGLYGFCASSTWLNRGVLADAFSFSYESLHVPARVRARGDPAHGDPGVGQAPRLGEGLYAGSLFAVIGFVVNRMNVSITGFEGAQGGHYIPAWAEVMITLMIVAIGFAAFTWIAKNFPVYPEHEAEPRATVADPAAVPQIEASAPSGARADRSAERRYSLGHDPRRQPGTAFPPAQSGPALRRGPVPGDGRPLRRPGHLDRHDAARAHGPPHGAGGGPRELDHPQRHARRHAARRDGPRRPRAGASSRTIAASDGVHRVRILDRDGFVRHTSGPGSDETRLALDAFQCQICHEQSPVPSRISDATRRMREIGGTTASALPQRRRADPQRAGLFLAACHVHPDDRRILGIIDIELPRRTSWTSSSSRASGSWDRSALTLFGVTACRSWPLPHLDAGAAAGRGTSPRPASAWPRGDLTAARARAHERDEIGRSAARWNAMVEELAKARHELEDWSRTLEQRVKEKTAASSSDAHERMLVVEKMASLGKLAAVVAHEINNPLAGIATYAKLLPAVRRRGGGEPGRREPRRPDTDRSLRAGRDARRAAAASIVRTSCSSAARPGRASPRRTCAPCSSGACCSSSHQAELQEVEIQVEVDAGPAEGRLRRVADPAGRCSPSP